MKKSLLLFLMFVFLSFYSCQKDLENDIAENNQVDLKSVTATTSTVFDWEQVSSINLYGTGTRTLPWYNGAETQLPFSILTDYSKANGWEMVYNYLNDPLVAYPGKYYLIFYNRFTGIMRVFYYNIYDVTTASTTFWSVMLNQTCSLLNNSDSHFASPVATTRSQPTTYITNISTTASKGISRGWNAFDVEFTYDPNASSQQQKLSIASYGVSTSAITLTGNLNLTSEGAIVSKSSSNSASSLLNSVVSGIGEGSKSVFKTFCDSNKVKGLIKDAIVNIGAATVKTVLSSGANLIFGSFLGKFNQTSTTTQDVNIKTTGTVNINGEITSNMSSNIIPLSNLVVPGTLTSSQDNFLPSFTENFGAWNIQNTPVVWYSDERIYTSSDKRNYTAEQFLRIDPSSVKLVLNPAVQSAIQKYELRLNLVHYDYLDLGDGTYKYNWGKVFNSTPYCDNFKNYEVNISQNIIFTDKKLQIRIFNGGTQGGYGLLANTTYLPSKVEDYTRYDNKGNPQSDYIYCQRNSPLPSYNYVVKVTLVLYPNATYSTGPIVLTRSYIPKYERKAGLLDPVGW